MNCFLLEAELKCSFIADEMHGYKDGALKCYMLACAEVLPAYLNDGEYTEQWGALVFIHWCWSNKTEAFKELVGICTGRDTWGI